MTLLDHIRGAGFPFMDNIGNVFIGGSELHGAKVGQTDDLDIYGIFMEPPDRIVGLDSYEHFVWSTAGSERRNGPDDVDISLYSMRKWAGMAAKGNPTALHFLFAANMLFFLPRPVNTAALFAWQSLSLNRDLFLSKKASSQFKGFADAQLRRLQGLIGNGRHGQRPEYIGKHGYDTKAAMHVIRLLNEGIELMRTGFITLPRPEKDLLIEIRTGEYGSLEKVLDLSNRLFRELDDAVATSKLPDKVDRAKLNSTLSHAYLRFWRENEETTQKTM